MHVKTVEVPKTQVCHRVKCATKRRNFLIVNEPERAGSSAGYTVNEIIYLISHLKTKRTFSLTISTLYCSNDLNPKHQY